MANPRFLFCDSDAVFQIFLTKQYKILVELSNKYSMRPLVVPEVELELFSSKKFKKLGDAVSKAISRNILGRFDNSVLIEHLGGSAAAATTVYANIQSRGARYAARVGKGEAYTFAAAYELRMPALSNDFSAIKVLANQQESLPSPICRFFDLVVLAYQAGILTDREVDDNVRQELQAQSEFIPKAFSNTSFSKGLYQYSCRIRDGSKACCGAERDDQSDTDYGKPLTLSA